MKRFLIALMLIVGSSARAQTAIGKYGSLTPISANTCPTGKVCLWYDSIATKLKLRVSGSDAVGFGTLQDAYNNGGAGPQIITLDSTRLGVRILDAATPITGSMFSVMNNSQSVFYFRLSSAGVSRLTAPSPTSNTGFISDTVNDFTGSGHDPWEWYNHGNLLLRLRPTSGPNTNVLIGGTGSVISEAGGGPIGNVSSSVLTTSAPSTLTSGATITPTQRVHYVSGTLTISTIAVGSLPANFSGEVILIPTGAWATNTAGNIANVITATANVPVVAVYDSVATKWYLTSSGSSSAAPAWTEVGSGGGAPSFGSSVSNFGAGESTLAFFKDNDGNVHLKGVYVAGLGSGSLIFTLPAGYRPPATAELGGFQNAVGTPQTYRVNIATSGDITAYFAGSATFLSLDGLIFRNQ